MIDPETINDDDLLAECKNGVNFIKKEPSDEYAIMFYANMFDELINRYQIVCSDYNNLLRETRNG